jgi:hypothetical protein
VDTDSFTDMKGAWQGKMSLAKILESRKIKKGITIVPDKGFGGQK